MNGILKLCGQACRTMYEWCVELLFPLRCPVCDKIVPRGSELKYSLPKICPQCISGLKLLTQPWCMQCGRKLTEEGEYCRDCAAGHSGLRKKHEFIRGRALYEYESVAASIYKMKYGGRQEYADFFGEEICKHLGDFICHVKPDGLVPIPLHAARERKRGFNQAAVLAKAVGKYSGVAVYDNLLKRVKNTVPLKLQNPKERQNNLKKAFKITQNDVKLNTIIIIDDIYTIGSTIDEAARVLRQCGVQRIYFITLACGAGI